MVSAWIENTIDKDRLLLKHQLCPPLPVWGWWQRLFNELATFLPVQAADANLGEVARRSSWAIELLALCLNTNNNNEQLKRGDWNSLKVNLEIMDQRPGRDMLAGGQFHVKIFRTSPSTFALTFLLSWLNFIKNEHESYGHLSFPCYLIMRQSRCYTSTR